MTKKTARQPDTGIDSYIEESMSNANPQNQHVDAVEHIKLRQDTAQYIHRMAADLCVMAAKADLDFLAYLIDMARIEAYDRAQDDVPDKKIHVG